MFELIRTIMTLNSFLSGYKTYISAFFLFVTAFAGWGTGVFLVWVNGDISMLVMIQQSAPYFAQMAAAFVASGLRVAIDEIEGGK